MCQHVADSAKIGNNTILGQNVVILDDVHLEDNIYMGHNVVVHKGTKIGSNVYIGDHCILGQMPKSGSSSRCQVLQEFPPLEIGDGCILRSAAILYASVKIGDNFRSGHNILIRENTEIGDNVLVGTNSVIDGDCKIGNNVSIQTGVYVTRYTTVEDGAFLGPCCVTTNDKYMKYGATMKGPVIKEGARIGANSTITPGITIGEWAIVGAGSVVTKDVPAYKEVMGVPARVVEDTPREEIMH